jgi:hypothetical protein
MAKRMSAFATVLLSFALLYVAGAVIVFLVPQIKEMFGAQGGEMVQLAAGHVPTEEDVQEMEEERRQVRRDLIDMTGSA